ncbi:MAG: ABC transporter permease, partial [Acidobacteriaceae bacterium]|nr:ABC transporter permease [Acidobacteriaceae bacterium]
RNDSVAITGLAEPEQVRALFLTDGVLPLLRVKPHIGRTFTRQDDRAGSPETVILTHGYWQRRFGGDPTVLGRRLIIDSKARQVIGVLPQRFHLLDSRAEVVLPLQFDRAKAFIGGFSSRAVARLKPGVSLQQANADEARMISLLTSKFPPAPGLTNKMVEDARLGPLVRPFKQDAVGDIGRVLWVLMGTVCMVLLVACANVANLLLIRAEGRQHELSIRAALGAGWRQIAGELLSESVTIAISGGLLGLALAYACIRVLRAVAPAHLPRLDEITIDPAVLLFTIAVSLLAGILFGLIPVFKYARPHLGTSLRESGRSLSEGRERHRARGILVVAQVALALVLLISSGLMIRTAQAMKSVQPGFERPQEVLTLRVTLPSSQVPDDMKVLRIHHAILQKLQGVAGVESASMMNSVTMDGYSNNDPIFAEDHTYAENTIPPVRRFRFVAPGSFQTLGTPLIAGRDFTWSDIYEGRPYVMVSQNLAKELWGSAAGAIGKRVHENPKAPWREVIGVSGDQYDDGVDEKPTATVLLPFLIKNFWGEPIIAQRNAAFAIRSPRTGSASFLNEVRQAVWAAMPDAPIAEVHTLQEFYERSMARTQFTLVMLTIAAGMALLLGVIGIYGVIGYSVSQRRREIGIRMALGAASREVTTLFVRHVLQLAVIGLGCGVIVAFLLTRWMSSLLFGVSPLDPLTYASVCLLLAAAALLAGYIPARRAATVDPTEALRAE